MRRPVATKDPKAVEEEVQSGYRSIFPNGDHAFVSKAFDWTEAAFTGNYKDYQAVDAPYHDFEHTLQGTVCLAHLLCGRYEAGAQPPIGERLMQLGILAILLHDTGYLKKRDDTEGTGAKYTVTHVERSADFAGEFLVEKGFAVEEIRAVQNMICCTAVEADLGGIKFQSEVERIVGLAVGSADLIGQMAAEDYLDRLPVLYAEFAEAARYSPDAGGYVAMYSSAEDLMKKTPAFWKEYVQVKLNQDFGGLYRFLSDPYPDGPNEYLRRIEANMKILQTRLRKLKNGK